MNSGPQKEPPPGYTNTITGWKICRKSRATQRIDELMQFKQRLATLKRDVASRKSKLPADDEIDLIFLQWQVEAELLDLNVLREWTRNPMVYSRAARQRRSICLIKRDFAPPAERLRAVISRERGIPAVFEVARENLKEPPREFTDLAIRMAKGSLGFFEGPVAAWAEKAAGQDNKLLADFHEWNARTIAVFREFAAWLETDLKPRSKGQYAIGKDLFLAKLKAEEMVDMSLEQLLARGEANLEKDYQSFVATAKQIDPNKSPAEVMKSLSDRAPNGGRPDSVGAAVGRGGPAVS